MTTEVLTSWLHRHAYAAAALLVLLVGGALLWRYLRRGGGRRTPAAVVVASLAAMACTAYSADTSWRFATHHLGMTSDAERAAMFAAAELALFAVALMARQNLRTQGSPGTPGVLVWVITGVQIIPAFAESGFVGGLVRAFVGPILAAVLWHLAMGIELRHAKPGANSQSLPSILARELRERLLSRLGLAARNRSAEQITRDRWTVKAVALAAQLADMKPGARGRVRVARRLSVAVGRAQAGAQPEQRQMLLQLLAARRHATELATMTLPSPWETGTAATPVPEPDPVPAAPVSPPELEAVPDPVPVPVRPPRPALRPRTKKASRRTGTAKASTASFDEHVRTATGWLTADPGLSGTAIGDRLGTGDSYGRRVKRAATGTATKPGPSAGTNPVGQGGEGYN